MKSRLLTVLLLPALVLAIASCGGDDGPGDAQSEFTVELSDFAFDPDVVAVPPGEEITVTLENVGSVQHTWVILEDGERIEEESDIPDDISEIAMVNSGEVSPGDTATVTFTAPESGVYQIICDIPGHFSAGMEGRIGVEEG